MQVIKQLNSSLLTNHVDYVSLYSVDLTYSISDLGSSSSHDCSGRSGDQWREVHVQSRELIVLTVRQTASLCMSAAFSNLNDEDPSSSSRQRLADDSRAEDQLIARSKSRKTEHGRVAW